MCVSAQRPAASAQAQPPLPLPSQVPLPRGVHLKPSLGACSRLTTDDRLLSEPSSRAPYPPPLRTRSCVWGVRFVGAGRCQRARGRNLQRALRATQQEVQATYMRSSSGRSPQEQAQRAYCQRAAPPARRRRPPQARDATRSSRTSAQPAATAPAIASARARPRTMSWRLGCVTPHPPRCHDTGGWDLRRHRRLATTASLRG